MGRTDALDMGPGYAPVDGIWSMVSRTPPILGMLPVRDGAELVAEAGVEAIAAKFVLLTSFAIEIVDSWPEHLGVRVASPRESAQRGAHVTIVRPDFRQLMSALWARGVTPDLRAPDGIRIAMAPLSTSFLELKDATRAIRAVAGGGAGRP